MKETKLYYLLQHLTKTELKELGKAVSSPLFNTNPTVKLLFELLKKHHPHFEITSAVRIKTFHRLFPNQPYKDQKLRRLFSGLSKVVEQFYIHLELKQEAYKKKKLLSEAFGRRNMYKLFYKQSNELLDENDGQTQDADFYLKKMSLLKKLYFHPQHDKYNLKDTTLEELSDSLDAFFALSKMQLAIASKNQMKILNQQFTLRFLSAIDLEVENGFLNEHPIFQLYANGLQILGKHPDIDFEKYEQLVFQHLKLLNAQDALILFYNGLNYAIRQSNNGNYQFGEKAFRWYLFGLEHQLFLNNDQLSEATFSNIVLFACKQKAFDWVDRFIKEYQAYLNPAIRKEESLFCTAVMNYYEAKFERIIENLSSYSFSKPYILKTRNILIRTYFELFLQDKDHYLQLENALHAFENYLYKNELFDSQRKEAYLHLIQILKGLSKRILQKIENLQLRQWLQKQLNNRQNISGKQWLQERFNLKLS